MSLLVTSCTMGKQPDRLLNKGPEYLRTRTNRGLFAQHRKSAVELLAASKSQFYNSKESVALDRQQDLAVSHGQSERYRQASDRKEPPRSKSQYDLSQLQLTREEDEGDENNNDTSEESIDKSYVVEHTQRLTLEDNLPEEEKSISESAKGIFPVNEENILENAAINTDFTTSVETLSQAESGQQPKISLSGRTQPKLTILRSSAQVSKNNGNEVFHVDVKSKDTVDSSPCGNTGRKPVPLPRKPREKPIPHPRKRTPRTSVVENNQHPNLNSKQNSLAPNSHRRASAPNQNSVHETLKQITKPTTLSSETRSGIRKKHSLVESLTHHFTTLSATSPVSDAPPQTPGGDERKNVDITTPTLSKCTYTATPIFIGTPATSNTSFQAKPIFISESGKGHKQREQSADFFQNNDVSKETLVINKGRKRCPELPVAGTIYVKRERKSVSSDSPSLNLEKVNCESVTVEKCNSSSTSKSEMSIESADQAVYESEINALPSAPMETEGMQDEEQVREVTRANSSLSGKIEHDASPLSHSPTPLCSSVPRSHSDISCRLESQHSRDSSIVSNHSRLSRASAGADLENFFNQMGLEKGVLEPLSRLRELQTSEIFDSMSSLDSHDAASICSTYSRSENEWSDTQSVERTHQQTSIVERNARIIKWLCNVRKAKTQPLKGDSATAGKA